MGGYSSGAAMDQHALNGDTNKFSMNRETLNDVPGMSISPSHGRMSVVTGLRIYTANNNPNADPVKYRIKGRNMGGANVKDRRYNSCWWLNDSQRINPTADCDSSSPRQKFYMNDLGEIRVKSHPGLCLDPRYGMEAGYEGNVMIQCFSDTYGANHDLARNHKFTFDPSTERLESVIYPGYCIDYEFILGFISMGRCHTGQNQRFYYSGDFDDTADDSWTLIKEGDLPWISEFDRNPLGVGISSTYENGDDNKYYMEVKFYGNTIPYYEYQIRFLELRNPEYLQLQFSEIELPGLLLE